MKTSLGESPPQALQGVKRCSGACHSSFPCFGIGRRGSQRSNRVAERVRTAPRCEARHLRVAIVANAVAAALALWTVPVVSQELTPVEVQSIAREAYIYGFPMVENYCTMYASAIDRNSQEFAAPFNTLQHEANVFTAADTDVVTPNADVLISLLWMDLRTQPDRARRSAD